MKTHLQRQIALPTSQSKGAFRASHAAPAEDQLRAAVAQLQPPGAVGKATQPFPWKHNKPSPHLMHCWPGEQTGHKAGISTEGIKNEFESNTFSAKGYLSKLEAEAGSQYQRHQGA